MDAKSLPVTSRVYLIPRLIRLKDAPFYLGMDKNRFNQEVRPHLVEVNIGKQGVAFDRIDLDAWVDNYINRNGRPNSQRGEKIWDEKKSPDCIKETVSGRSTKKSEVDEFAKALEKATCKKPRKS